MLEPKEDGNQLRLIDKARHRMATYLRAIPVLGLVCLALGGCTKLGQYYPSKARGLAVATHDSAEASKEDVQALLQRRAELEQDIVGLRARVTAAEAKADVCEAEAKAMTRGGSYSKVR